MIVGEQVTTVTVTTTTGSAGAMEAAAAPPAYTTTTTETTEKTVQEQPRPSQGYSVDTTYPRSLEGILRIITVPIAALGSIFVIATIFIASGGWFFFVGISYIIYVAIVFVIEMCIPRVYVHRLIDGIISLGYAAVWFLAAILNTAFGVIFANVLLGLAALCGYICGALCIVQGILALRTWRNYEAGRHGSRPIIFV